MFMIEKYTLLCVSVLFIVIIATLTSSNIIQNEYDEDERSIGIVYDIRKTEKGFSFYFEDIEGSKMKCFSYDEPVNNGLYKIRGNLSNDGNMFFIDLIELLDQA